MSRRQEAKPKLGQSWTNCNKIQCEYLMTTQSVHDRTNGNAFYLDLTVRCPSGVLDDSSANASDSFQVKLLDSFTLQITFKSQHSVDLMWGEHQNVHDVHDTLCSESSLAILHNARSAATSNFTRQVPQVFTLALPVACTKVLSVKPKPYNFNTVIPDVRELFFPLVINIQIDYKDTARVESEGFQSPNRPGVGLGGGGRVGGPNQNGHQPPTPPFGGGNNQQQVPQQQHPTGYQYQTQNSINPNQASQGGASVPSESMSSASASTNSGARFRREQSTFNAGLQRGMHEFAATVQNGQNNMLGHQAALNRKIEDIQNQLLLAQAQARTLHQAQQQHEVGAGRSALNTERQEPTSFSLEGEEVENHQQFYSPNNQHHGASYIDDTSSTSY